MAMGKNKAWDVYAGGRLLATVYYPAGWKVETVRRSLINKEGYSMGIVVIPSK